MSVNYLSMLPDHVRRTLSNGVCNKQASGNLGSSSITPLHEAGFTVTVLTRPQSTTSFPEWAKVVKANYTDKDTLVKAFTGQDAVVACSAPTAARLLNDVVDAAIAAGVKLFIPSDFVTDIFHPKIPELGIYNDKLAHNEYLVSKAKEGKITWTSILSGLWLDWGMYMLFIQKLSAPSLQWLF